MNIPTFLSICFLALIGIAFGNEGVGETGKGDFRTSSTYLSIHADVRSRLDKLSTFVAEAGHVLGHNIELDSSGKLRSNDTLNCHHYETGKDEQVFLQITEYQFGNTGNQFIELTHALWLADRFKATLVIPQYMAPILKGFDLKPLHSHFCLIQEQEFNALKSHPGHEMRTLNVIELESEESFWFYKVLIGKQHESRYPKQAPLPILSQKFIQELSLHSLYVAALFWSSINTHVLNESLHLIHRQLHASFDYIAVHKRSMEGGCSKILNSAISVNEFDIHQLPMDAPQWKGNLGSYHPLCDYPLTFVKKTVALYDHEIQANEGKAAFTGINELSPIFLAWDGRGSVEDYRVDGHVAISIDHTKEQNLQLSGETLKLLDMFVAMNSGLFILNPRSTFSWQIYLIRTILNLPSLPVMKTKDMYVEKQSVYDKRSIQQKEYMSSVSYMLSPEYAEKRKKMAEDKTTGVKDGAYDGLWVSWTSVVDVMSQFRKKDGVGVKDGRAV